MLTTEAERAEDDERTADATAPAGPRPARRARFWLLLLLPLVAGGAVRLVAGLADDAITTDASAYLRSGISIWDGDGFEREGNPELHFPPVTPALLGGATELFDDPQTGTVVATILLGVLVIVPAAGIGRRLGGDRAGLAAGWFVALAPGLVIVPANQGGGSENPFILLVLTAVWIALVAATRRDRWLYVGAAGAGVCIGLAYLTRPEGIGYTVVALTVLLGGALGGAAAVRRRRPDAGWLRRGALVGLAFGLGAATFVLPYASFLHTNTGSWQLTAKNRDASLEAWRAVAEGDRRLRDEIFYELQGDSTDFAADRFTLTQLMRDDPEGYAGIVATNVEEAAGELVLGSTEPPYLAWQLLPIPVTLLALWAAWRGRRSWKVRVVVTLAAFALAAPLAFFVKAAYLLPFTAVLCVLAGVGLAQVRRRWLPLVGLAVVVTLVPSLYAGLGGPQHFLARREAVEHRIAGEWLDEHAPADARVMTRSLVVDFYADRQMIPMPYSSVPRMVQFARDTGTDYVVIDEFQLLRNRPPFISLFLPGPWEGLALEHEFLEAGRLTRIFRVDPPGLPDDEADLPQDIAFTGDTGG